MVHMHVYARQCEVIKEVIFCPRFIFPLRYVGSFFSFPCSPRGLGSSSMFHGIQGALLPPSVGVRWSRTRWSGWGGGGACLASQESRRLARPLHSDSLPEYTQIREEATGKRRKGTRSHSKRAERQLGSS